MGKMGDAWAYFKHYLRANTIVKSKKNIEAHYDAGNDMYKLFLDKRMIYSSAIFEHEEDTLEDAQLRKLREIATKANIDSTDNVLEIGCGWGEMAIFLVREYGCSVTGITLSVQQLEEANARVKAE